MASRSLLLAAAFGVAINASPQWHNDKYRPPGWSGPHVYTPPQPKATWPGHHQFSSSVDTESAYTTTVSTATASSTVSATGSVTSATSASSVQACASVSELVASATSANPSATPKVPADLAYECINSVPFNQSAAADLLTAIRPYLNWQTTIEYLKDPPAEYAEKVQPAFDFFANYDRINDDVLNGSYANEYAFGFDLYRAFQQAHDGHFVYYPDSVTGVFAFGRTTPLVSVSVDGTSIPEVFVYADVLAASFGNITFTPSPITLIDGQNSTEFLLNWSQYGSLQDRDALWNNMFYIPAQVSLGASGTGTGTFSGGGRGRWIYPGPSTTLTFANGSSVTNDNYASVLVPFDGITTGQDLYTTYFTPTPDEEELVEELATMTYSSSVASATSTATATSSTSIPAPGYPSPIVRETNNLNGGYFLEGEGYDDVAVLSVPSFVGSDDDEIPFQAVNTYFLNRAVAANKTKLIIDLSANAGGTILQGYDLFKQLFPSLLPYGATRFRAHEAFDLIGQEVSAYANLVPRSLSTNETVQDIVSTAWAYQTDDDINYHPFTSWAEKYGPHAYGPQPDNFTSIIRWNMSDVLTPDNSGGIDISGYLNRTNITTQPFAAENIVLVYDGYCASTCTIFSQLMTAQGGVSTIALGGRPNTNPIQAVGGVKGTNDYPFDYILSGAELPFQLQLLHDAAYYNSTALAAYSELPLYRSTDAVVNARDGIRQGDAAETPLQFVYEEADCRIFYTPEMVVDETAVWKTVADTAFKGVSHCVAGSYPSGGSAEKEKRGGEERKRHVVRRDLDRREHLDAMESVWTGKGGVGLSGDGLMHV